jgi:hypothetical protein
VFSHRVAAANATCLRNFNWDDKIVGMMKEVTHVHATFRAQGAKVVLTNQLLVSMGPCMFNLGSVDSKTKPSTLHGVEANH